MESFISHVQHNTSMMMPKSLSSVTTCYFIDHAIKTLFVPSTNIKTLTISCKNLNKIICKSPSTHIIVKNTVTSKLEVSGCDKLTVESQITDLISTSKTLILRTPKLTSLTAPYCTNLLVYSSMLSKFNTSNEMIDCTILNSRLTTFVNKSQSLRSLNLNNNLLSIVDIDSPVLTNLNLSNNSLVSLNLSHPEVIITMDLSLNNIIDIDLSGFTNFLYIDLSDNLLTSEPKTPSRSQTICLRNNDILFKNESVGSTDQTCTSSEEVRSDTITDRSEVERSYGSEIEEQWISDDE